MKQPIDTEAAAPLSLEQRMGLSPYKLRRWRLTHAWRIRGPLDPVRLENALNAVAERHAPLRMRLVTVDGGTRQTFAPVGDSYRIHSVPVQEPRLETAVRELAERELDVFTHAPLRVDLLRVTAADHLLLLTVHHMAWDAWSGGLFWHELWQAYRSEHWSPAPLAAHYADFAREQSAQGGELTAEQAAYWRAVACGAPRPWPVVDTVPPLAQAADGHRGARLVAARPDTTFARRLTAFARTCRVTAASAVTTLCLVALAKTLGQDSVLACYQHHGRDAVAHWDLIGMFTRRYLVRAQAADDPPLGELARQVQRDLTAGATHSRAPFTLPRLRRLMAAETSVMAAEASGSGPAPLPWHPGISPVTINVVPGRMRTGHEPDSPTELTAVPLRGAEIGLATDARYRGQLWLIVTTDPEPVFHADYDRTVVRDGLVRRIGENLTHLTSLLDAESAQCRLSRLWTRSAA